MVLDVTRRQRPGFQTVPIRVDRIFRGCNDRSCQVGIALDRHVETLISRLNSRLVHDAGEVTVDLLMADVDAAGRPAETHRSAPADRLVFRLVAAGVLKTLDVQIAVDPRDDALAAHRPAADIGIASR